MVKFVVSIVLTIVAYFLFKKSKTVEKEPISDNRTFVICLLPALTQLIISKGVLNLTVAFGKFLLISLSSIFSVLWMQLLIVGAGVNFLRDNKRSGITLSELFPILGVFTMIGIIDGFGINLLFNFGIALMSVALYVKTNSLDLSIAVHLIINSVITFSDMFVTAYDIGIPTYNLLYLCNSVFIIIIGIWVLQDVYLTSSAEEGKFNG